MEGINVETFLGPPFIILCVSFMLYGFFCAQLFYYYTTYQDHIALKLVVFLLWSLETVHAAASIHVLYTYLIIDYANPLGLLTLTRSYKLLIYLEHAIEPLVQSYYIYRAWRVSENKMLISGLSSVLFVRIVVGFSELGLFMFKDSALTTSNRFKEGSAYACTFDSWVALVPQKILAVYLNTTFSFAIAEDFLVASTLTYYFTLKRHNSAHARSTKRILLKLTYYAITAGALTAITNVVSMIWYNIDKNTLTYAAIAQLSLKLAGNGMLAMLNARKSLTRNTAATNGMSLELSQPSNRAVHAEQTIHVLRETFVEGHEQAEGKYVHSSHSSNLAVDHTKIAAV